VLACSWKAERQCARTVVMDHTVDVVEADWKASAKTFDLICRRSGDVWIDGNRSWKTPLARYDATPGAATVRRSGFPKPDQ
jgi:hypothetical protein